MWRNVWWSTLGNGIQFHDCPDEVEEREAGPPLQHFDSSDLQKERHTKKKLLSIYFLLILSKDLIISKYNYELLSIIK